MMRRLGTFIVFLAGLIGVAIWIGPYESVALDAPFDEAMLGSDVDSYLADREAVFDDLEAGAEKRVVWSGEAGVKTPLSIVYVHGFSASSEEIRPVPDRIAADLGANLYFARLAGHGRGGDAMAGPVVNDWMIDMAEAMAIGRTLGERVVVIGTSTGGTLAAMMAQDPEMSRDVAGVVFVSPNFRIKAGLARLLTWPGARYWLPLLAGETREFAPQNEDHAKHWTQRYPSAALFPMAALVQAAREADYAGVKIPALFYFSPQDQVVDAAAARGVATKWGGTVEVTEVAPGEGIDPYNHVIAGNILSPGGTEDAVQGILHWIGRLPLAGES
ncbi:alpha/beta fold hydrolase [Aliiroseovarius sp. KMU-50]|uniref:Alpha/beta fold hydrolase n=1 Tax=Aliiroseovarius salicola TaxID=3009082 RepID=A0ABT4W190_9RHOB|nr:alpha/beta fold hydrolase [Aliiroseovarius sp. KMU-50]MDA5094273.1 alpha/beta fold hydrolase [Aliiroseovarius sp. KMU-50]